MSLMGKKLYFHFLFSRINECWPPGGSPSPARGLDAEKRSCCFLASFVTQFTSIFLFVCFFVFFFSVSPPNQVHAPYNLFHFCFSYFVSQSARRSPCRTGTRRTCARERAAPRSSCTWTRRRARLFGASAWTPGSSSPAPAWTPSRAASPPSASPGNRTSSSAAGQYSRLR